MKRAVAALLAAFVVLAGFAGVSPANAEAYNTTVQISDVVVVGGNRIFVRAQTSPPTQCQWTVSFSGEAAQYVIGPNPDAGSGTSFNKTYDTKRVPRTVTGSATASCRYDDAIDPSALGGVGRFSTAFVTALQTASATGSVTLLPLNDSDSDDNDDNDDSDDGDDDDNGGLPNTGGERLMWLIIGLVLVAGGATVVVTSRKRNADA